MSIPYSSKINQQTATPVSSESHVIGIVGTATYAPGFIRLVQVPQGPAPAVTIPGYVEITSGSPTSTQFLVNYSTGVITFNTSQDGNTISASYDGLGSEFAAEDLNELQEPLNIIGSQSITYNWPSAPTVTWSLASAIVKPNNISTSNTDNFTFPNNVTVSGLTSTGIVHNNASGSLSTSLIVNADVSATAAIAFNKLASLPSAEILVGNGSNVATAVSLSGDATLSNAGILTLDTVNSSPNTYTYATITVNGKGLVTSASNGTAPTTYTAGTGLTLTGSQFSLTIPVTVPDGGTGATSFTSNEVITGNGTSALSSVTTTSNSFFIAFGGTLEWLPIGTAPSFAGWSSTAVPAALTLLGTTNEIIVTAAGSNVTLSTPQAIGTTSAVQFGSLSLGGSANSSAILTLDSTTQGFLLPAMTSTQRTAISSPASGLMVFDTTTDQFYGYNGSSWVILG